MDSWGWITLAKATEPHHKTISEYYKKSCRDFRMVTSDYILDEVVTFLFAKTPKPLAPTFLKGLWESVQAGHIQLETISRPRFESAWKMRMKHYDHEDISFTDFTSFVLMKEMKIQKVITNDHHFEKLNLGFSRVPLL